MLTRKQTAYEKGAAGRARDAALRRDPYYYHYHYCYYISTLCYSYTYN